MIVDAPGLGRLEFPDGMSHKDMADAIDRAMKQKAGAMALENTTALQRFVIGSGKAVNDVIQGGKQILGLSDKKEEADTRARDTALMSSGAGLAGNVAGNVAMVVPTARIPGANTYKGAAAVSGLLGGLQPVVEGESRGQNAFEGVVTGAIAQGIGNAVGRVMRPVRSQLPKQDAALAAAAEREGIPLTAGQSTGSRPLLITESVMENLPMTSGAQLGAKEAQAKAYNQAVLKRAGITGDEATATVLAAQKKKLGNDFSTIAGRNSIDFNQGPIMSDLGRIAAEGSRRLSHPQALTNTIDDIINDAANGVMSGQKYQGWRETLRRLASGTDSEAHYFSEVKKALDKGFSSQISAADSALWKQASREYGNLKTITDAVGGAGAATKGGHIPPAQLEGALTRAIGREGKALGRGDLNELVSIGRKFVSEQIPNSGTAQRLAAQSLLTGGGAGVGAIGAAATGNDWMTGAGIGLGVTGGGLLSPKLIQMMMNSPKGQAYLRQGLLSMTPEQQAIINAASRASAAGLLTNQ